MYRGISNDQSLEDTCPSFARAAAVFREQVAQATSKEALDSPIERARTLLENITARFTTETPHARALPDFIRDIGAIRPALLESIHQIAKNPDQIAATYRLDDTSFERGWKKLLDLMESLDAAMVSAEVKASTVDHVARLHTRLLDVTMELNRISTRASHPAVPPLEESSEGDGPISLEEAREAASGTEPWDSPKGGGFRGF